MILLPGLVAIERMIHILFVSNLHDLAQDYVRALDHVLWQQPDDVSLWDYLQGPKVAFLAAAREQLGG